MAKYVNNDGLWLRVGELYVRAVFRMDYLVLGVSNIRGVVYGGRRVNYFPRGEQQQPEESGYTSNRACA